MINAFADKHPRTFLVLFFGAVLIAEPLVDFVLQSIFLK